MVEVQPEDKINKSLGTTKGDVVVYTGSATPVRLGIGTDTHVLTADSGEASGIKWVAGGGGGASTEKIGFPAEALYLPVDNPATLTEELGATSYAGQSHMDFDDTTAEHAVARSPGVIDYDGGNIVIKACAKVATTPATAKTLIFHIYAVGIANSEAYDAAVTVDTGVDITFNIDTTELLTDMIYATATIDPVNVANGDKLVIEFIRNVATDTLVGDGELIDFTAEYARS